MTMNGIIAQFADEAAFLWGLRDKVVDQPHFSHEDLALLDERLEAHIDGLRVAGDAGWESCRNSMRRNTAGAIFPAAVLAFEEGSEPRVPEVTEAVAHDRGRARALISALGWLPFDRAEAVIERFLTDSSFFHRYVGMAASAIHRRDPRQHLERAASDSAPVLKARALRAYGELGRNREADVCTMREALTAKDDEIRFSAAWSATLAGCHEAVETLLSFVAQTSCYSIRALNMALRRMDSPAAHSFQRHLATSPGTIRLAVIAAGIIGDAAFVPWLIEQMNVPVLARVAGEALTMTTGIDFALEGLQGVRPDGFEAGPNDDPKDAKVAMDQDRNLPWPNVDSVSAWWEKNKGNYPSGIHLLLGKPLSTNQLRNVLLTGSQRQRASAALELAMMNPGQPLFEVRAPAFRQKVSGLGQ